MPTYDYRCDCGHAEERFCPVSEAVPVLPCPVCGKRALRLQISSGAGIIFKGPGWQTNARRERIAKAKD